MFSSYPRFCALCLAAAVATGESAEDGVDLSCPAGVGPAADEAGVLLVAKTTTRKKSGLGSSFS
ncbi:MAG: hypothetical protein ACRD44_15100, partial [Bryobacteraceae bacterium]